MLFPTFDFALFFIVVFTASWLIRNKAQPRKLILLGASYFFYGYWDYRFLALLAVSSTMNYAAGVAMTKAENDTLKRRIAAVAVIANLVILGFFKYYGFFLESLIDLMIATGLQRDLPFLEIILPIGISFFTFQGISYVVDVYRKQIKPVETPVDLFLYISFFPQLVAGPIVRASDFLPQLAKKCELNNPAVVFGFLLILSGLVKKTLVAHYLAVELVDPVFFDPSSYSSLDLIGAHYGYTVQVYCDFSGYSDIAIGAAALLGYRFKKNFDRPFSATSLVQLWQRWHISLSTWLRDYLYRWLRGAKRDSGWRMYKNIFLTMLLGGLWHGAAWTFVIWGAIHGAALVAERVVKGKWNKWTGKTKSRQTGTMTIAERCSNTTKYWLGWLFTFHVFSIATIFFRSPDMETATAFFAGIFQWTGSVELFSPFMLALIIGAVAIQFLPGNVFERIAQRYQNAGMVALGLMLGGSLLLMEAIGPEGVAPFIYFQF